MEWLYDIALQIVQTRVPGANIENLENILIVCYPSPLWSRDAGVENNIH